MSTIVVQAFMSLDGVVQAGGGPDEDREGDFEHGGWTQQIDETDLSGEGGNIVEEWESRTEGLLLGRKTYEIFAGSWGVWDEHAPGMQGEFTRRYNRIPKYVASRTQTEFAWQNTHLLAPDLAAAVEELRAQPGGEIRVWGSTELVKALAAHDLIDEYRLAIYPIVLGTGKRLFSEGFSLSRLALIDSHVLDSGVVINVYRRAVA